MIEKPTLVIRPKAQITKASLKRTSLLLILGSNAEMAAVNTTAIAAVVAAWGLKSKMYRRIGTESIAPPAPINPRTAPMKPPASNPPMISIG